MFAEVEHHAEDGAWAFHIAGLAEGETTIRIKINHGGHVDFVSGEIEIHVSEDGPGEEHDHEEGGDEYGIEEMWAIDGNLVSGRTWHDHGRDMKYWIDLIHKEVERMETES